METKITYADGRYSIIVDRDQEARFTKIAFVSSTEPQTFVAANFDATGNEIGGRTMTKMAVDRLIQVALEKGLLVEVQS